MKRETQIILVILGLVAVAFGHVWNVGLRLGIAIVLGSLVACGVVWALGALKQK